MKLLSHSLSHHVVAEFFTLCFVGSQVADIMHALFGTHKEAVLPFFEQLLPDFHSLLVSE